MTDDLDLTSLCQGIPALTAALGTVHAESAAVCLENQGHSQGVAMHLRHHSAPTLFLYWPPVTRKMMQAYADLPEATEIGACGVAILLVRKLTGHVAIERAWKGTGFDYWLGNENTASDLPFQQMARLEVSGILNGTEAQVKSRITAKKRQTEQSDRSRLPAFVVVVEFGKPQAEVVER